MNFANRHLKTLAAFNGLAASERLGRSSFPKRQKQTEATRRMNTHTRATGNDMTTLEDARAWMAATADVMGKKVAKARKRLAAALESAKEITGCGRENAVQIPAISKGGRSGTNQTPSRLSNWGPFVTGCNSAGRSGFGRIHDEAAFMKSQLG